MLDDIGTNNTIRDTYLLDARSGPNPTGDSGPLLYFDSSGGGISGGYNSGSYFVSEGSGSIKKYEIDVNNTGDILGDGAWVKTEGSISPTDAGIITGNTGMDIYKTLIISPTSSAIPVATSPSWSLSLFANDSQLTPAQDASSWHYNLPSPTTEQKSAISIASVYAWNRVLADTEIENLNIYITNGLGYNT